MNSLHHRLVQMLAAAGSILGIACATGGGPDPQFDTGSRAERTADGLDRIRSSGFSHAWIRPGVTFSDHDSVAFAPLLVAYKRKPRESGPASIIEANNPLNEEQLATFRRYFSEAFQREFAKSRHFEIVETPRARTLVIVPAIVDLVVEAPTDPARIDESFASSTAFMTLLLDVRDGATGEVLARVAERRSARTPGSQGTNALTRSDAVSAATAFRTTFGGWARSLRKVLDRVHEAPPIVPQSAPPI